MAVLAVIVFFILPKLWGWAGFPILIVLALAVVTVILVRWHARHTGYRCPECGFTFAVSPVTDFLSPHKSGEKMLRCPRCLRSSWCLEISRASVTDDMPAEAGADIPPPVSAAPQYLQIMAVISLYVALWIVTLVRWPDLPAVISNWTVIKIPLATIVLVIMHATFCLYGARHGYRSRIYILITIFVAAFLLLAIWIQHSRLAQMT